jgi:5-(aminomethyl)-3-furanmethanol phosphate kinase
VIDAVVKIGGSLGRGRHLRALCERLAALGCRHRLLIVPGGGAFADVVRQYDSRFELSATTGHWMAILAMDQYGHMLADLIPGSVLVGSLAAARAPVDAGSVAVLLPFGLVRGADALPHGWTVTSDSIAAWVAGLAEAPTLVLLKDRLGFTSPLEGADASCPGSVTLDQMAAWQGVDGYSADLLREARFDLWVLNGEQPDRLAELLETGSTSGIRLPRSRS